MPPHSKIHHKDTKAQRSRYCWRFIRTRSGAFPVNPFFPLSRNTIKIDVEGAEWSVVQGFADLLPHLAPTAEVLIEVNADALADHGVTPAVLISLFASAGFRPFANWDQKKGSAQMQADARETRK